MATRMKREAAGGLGGAGVNAQMNSGLQQASAIHQGIETQQTPSNIFRIGDVGAGNANFNFPVSIGSTDPQDEQYQIQKNLVNPATGVVPGVGMALAGPDFFAYAQRKDQMQMLANYQAWVMQQADLTKPESQAWWFEKFPWMKEKRIEEINRIADLQKRSAEISVSGAQSDEDWFFIYLVKQGYIEIPDTAPHLLGTATYPATSYQQGFFSALAKKPAPVAIPVGSAGTVWSDIMGQGKAAPYRQINDARTWGGLLGNNQQTAGFNLGSPFTQPSGQPRAI